MDINLVNKVALHLGWRRSMVSPAEWMSLEKTVSDLGVPFCIRECDHLHRALGEKLDKDSAEAYRRACNNLANWYQTQGYPIENKRLLWSKENSIFASGLS